MSDATTPRPADRPGGSAATHDREPEPGTPLEAHVKIDLAVPAYVHPLVDPGVWDRLAEVARHLRFVIVNVDSGPGASLDPSYPRVIEQLRGARARTVGYVDSDYGRRSVEDVVADARQWVLRYGIQGVFVDQVAGDFEHLEYYAAVALGARACGAQYVVFNPGSDCHPGYADIANVTVTFEGTWAAYTTYRPPGWTMSRPAGRFCHLVYEVPGPSLATGPSRAAALHAGTAFFTDGGGSNPWDRLPEAVIDAIVRAHPGAVGSPSVGAPSWGGRVYVDGSAGEGTPTSRLVPRLRWRGRGRAVPPDGAPTPPAGG